MTDTTLKDRIVDGLRESKAAEFRQLEQQITDTRDKLSRLESRREQLIRQSDQAAVELAAAVQVAPDDQDAERWDGLS